MTFNLISVLNISIRLVVRGIDSRRFTYNYKIHTHTKGICIDRCKLSYKTRIDTS